MTTWSNESRFTVDLVSIFTLLNLVNKSNWCTILLNIFSYLLYTFRASTCPSSGGNYCIYVTLVFVILYGWRLVCWLDWINLTSRPVATHTEWQIPVSHRHSNFLQMMGTWMSETCKAVPLQAWSGPDGSRKLRYPDFMTTAQEGGKVVSLTHRPHLPPGNSPGTHFC